ncbi:putative Zn finger protein [Herbihabitans rhizosphaerae]|uniref:Putative Zn finger protein n=1 Tax=Herbihabitans rhizosphaerae TaxID=1872711 RepID=A0A4Q7KDI5_9PSEU|nr:SWIM zinc finger family protein [Herbihabitans rhizosphaerae]RZS31247.1 putative Zn finger protein [Herbihabitans rhizosphaerae]
MNTDRVKGFPAFPAGKRMNRRALSWWGQAWVQALEDTSLDLEQLRRGRKFATAGQVDTITVSPGRIAATVYDADDGPYATRVTLDELSDVEWERFLDQVAGRAGHIAALLDRDMPRDLVSAADDAGVRLLPGIGDLEPECDCAGWELPCKHAAALCYQVAWLMDADPFVLLLLRGRAESELLDELRSRNIAHAEPEVRVPGTPAAEAYAATPAALPAPPSTVDGSLAVPPFAAAPGVDPDGLRLLVSDAASRARALLAAGSLEPLDVRADAVRLAASDGDPVLRARLRPAVGEDFDVAVLAWRNGGAAGLSTWDTPWTPDGVERARAAAALADALSEVDSPPEFSRSDNWWTAGDVQLRYGRDRRWYPYRRADQGWLPAGSPDAEAGAVLADLIADSGDLS